MESGHKCGGDHHAEDPREWEYHRELEAVFLSDGESE